VDLGPGRHSEDHDRHATRYTPWRAQQACVWQKRLDGDGASPVMWR
jgi:hypothetical protein